MFTVKELFKGVTRSEIMFLNKGLKRLTELHDLPIHQATIPGERWPSNQWPDILAEHACGLLVGLRKSGDREYILDRYVDYPASKGWGTTPYYDDEWESYAASVGIDLHRNERETFMGELEGLE